MRRFVIFVITVFLVADLADAIRNICPKHSCKFSGTRAVCCGLGFIPAFPTNIIEAQFIRNTFNNISREFLSNLSTIHLKSLQFTSNQIHHIAEDSFVDLIFLKTLVISKESNLSSAVVLTALNSMTNCSLVNVHFEENRWKTIPNKMFLTPATLNVTKLYLSGNRLLNFSFDSLADLHQLRKLFLTNNKLIEIKMSRTVPLSSLDVGKNDIVRLQSFCISSSKGKYTSYFPNLKTLNLDANALSDVSSASFRCLPSLEKLILNRNRFNYIPSNFLKDLPSILELQIQGMPQPNEIRCNALKSSSLERLLLAENKFKFGTKRFHIANVFQDLPKLRHLDLSNSILPNSSNSLVLMFRSLRNIESLILQSANLYYLPVKFIQTFASLETLILQGNSITKLENRTFANMIHLKKLNMEGNNIHVLKEGFVPLEILTNLETLDVSNNPFSCTCDIKWFRDWLRDRNNSRPVLLNFPWRYKCMYPEDMKGTQLVKYNPTIESCKPWNPLFTLAIALSSFVILVFLVIISAYRCNANVRNYLYLLRLTKLKRKGYLRLDSRDEFEYDAFVVYCDADRTWVHTEFLPTLENKDIRLCIRLRDFEAGKPITDNVDAYLEKCWKVVIIMSNDFAENEWSQWETDFVQERRRQQGKGALILVMLKTIDSKHMTSPITTMIKTTPYLTYVKGIGENNFWRTVAESIKSPLNNPPVAV